MGEETEIRQVTIDGDWVINFRGREYRPGDGAQLLEDASRARLQAFERRGAVTMEYEEVGSDETVILDAIADRDTYTANRLSAARVTVDEQLLELAREEQLTGLPGIGEESAELIREVIDVYR